MRTSLRIAYCLAAVLVGAVIGVAASGMLLESLGIRGAALAVPANTVMVLAALTTGYWAWPRIGTYLESRPVPAPPTPLQAALRRVVILAATVPAIGPFSYGGWAKTFGWFILVAVALAHAIAGRRVFRDFAQVGGLLLLVLGVPFIGAFGLGLYPLVSGLAILAASRIGADGPASTTPGPRSAPTVDIS